MPGLRWNQLSALIMARTVVGRLAVRGPFRIRGAREVGLVGRLVSANAGGVSG